MKRPSGHPDDTQLIARYFGDDDPSVARHLGRCHACAARRDAIHSGLEAERARLASRANAYFTPARLDAQRADVLARLEGPRRARVLTFPVAGPAEPEARRAPSWRLRWAAAVATAAMVAVAGAGWLAEESRRMRPAASAAATGARWVVTAPAPAALEPDDTALAAIDVALARPGAAELRALDALTLRAVPANDRR